MEFLTTTDAREVAFKDDAIMLFGLTSTLIHTPEYRSCVRLFPPEKVSAKDIIYLRNRIKYFCFFKSLLGKDLRKAWRSKIVRQSVAINIKQPKRRCYFLLLIELGTTTGNDDYFNNKQLLLLNDYIDNITIYEQLKSFFESI